MRRGGEQRGGFLHTIRFGLESGLDFLLGFDTPDADAEHWAPFGDDAGETDPEQPDPEPEQPGDGYPVWEQPADSKSGYRKGDRVHYPDEAGPVYESDKNKNTDVPGESDAWFEV